jgi:BirA family transcriptional regulator, biotin operon repressor / biotin---[acetyl-CoA-carboxylase] ligase
VFEVPPQTPTAAMSSAAVERDPLARRASIVHVPSALGHPRLHLHSTASTNDRARALAIAGAPHGTLVTASMQSAGRGRQGRRWSAPPDSSLLMTLVLRDPPPLLPLITAVAVCDVADRSKIGRQARVKWPNDIVVVRAPGEGATKRAGVDAGMGVDAGAGDLAKLAGILAEGRPQDGWAVLGIGLNVAVRLDELPTELRSTAATLSESPAAIEPALARLLAALARRLAEPTEAMLDAYRTRDALRGREIEWSGGHGRADGIDGEGRLVVALAGGGHTALHAGEVHLTSS